MLRSLIQTAQLTKEETMSAFLRISLLSIKVMQEVLNKRAFPCSPIYPNSTSIRFMPTTCLKTNLPQGQQIKQMMILGIHNWFNKRKKHLTILTEIRSSLFTRRIAKRQNLKEGRCKIQVAPSSPSITLEELETNFEE